MQNQKIEIIPVEYGETVLPESAVFKGGSKEKQRSIPLMFYLLKKEDKKILVDVGCDTMPGFEVINHRRPVDVLADIGVAADEITDVIITHAHHDHIEAVHYFDKATIYIQEDEYKVGKCFLPQGCCLHLFADTCLVADCINVVKIGGHTQGSCIIIFETEGCRYLIAGDECYQRECLEKKIPTGSSCCPEKSRHFVEYYGNSAYKVLLCHDK